MQSDVTEIEEKHAFCLLLHLSLFALFVFFMPLYNLNVSLATESLLSLLLPSPLTAWYPGIIYPLSLRCVGETSSMKRHLMSLKVQTTEPNNIVRRSDKLRSILIRNVCAPKAVMELLYHSFTLCLRNQSMRDLDHRNIC